MRKLEKFKVNELSLDQQLNAIGGLMALTRSLCTTETCEENCSDTSATWTKDENDGTIISINTVITPSTNDCP